MTLSDLSLTRTWMGLLKLNSLSESPHKICLNIEVDLASLCVFFKCYFVILSSQFVHVRLLRVLNKDQSINQSINQWKFVCHRISTCFSSTAPFRFIAKQQTTYLTLPAGSLRWRQPRDRMQPIRFRRKRFRFRWCNSRSERTWRQEFSCCCCHLLTDKTRTPLVRYSDYNWLSNSTFNTNVLFIVWSHSSHSRKVSCLQQC